MHSAVTYLDIMNSTIGFMALLRYEIRINLRWTFVVVLELNILSRFCLVRCLFVTLARDVIHRGSHERKNSTQITHKRLITLAI